MESLIPIVNQLQEVISMAKVKTGIDLPRIIVVGSQSSGKSSVLESIVGKDFLPRGTGIVTRCPLVLRLIKINEEVEYAQFHHLEGCPFTEFSDVNREIMTISQEIALSEGVGTREILLNIYSNRVVDLTLIDLPGIIKVPLKGQAKNLDKKINDMIMDYARQQNSIILAISPANSDLANSDALNIARQVDPEGQRTIGVITKIDLMDRGTNALEMLEGKLYPLRLGYVGIICRSQEDIINNIQLHVHMAKEKKFFEDSKIYSHLASRLGIGFLSQRLSTIFKAHIQATIPKIKREITETLAKINKEISELGETLDTIEKKNDMLNRIINLFCKKFEDTLDGKEIDKCSVEFTGGSLIRRIFTNFFNNIIGGMDPLKDLSDYQIRIAILNATGSKGVMFVSEVAFENLVSNIIKRVEGPSLECLYSVKEELQKIISFIYIKEFERFPRLREIFVVMVYEILDSCIPAAEKNIQLLIEIESNFLNISHPDFINPNEAMQIAHSQLQEAAQRPRVERRPPESEQKGFFSFLYSSRNENQQVFEEIGDKEQKFMKIIEEEMTTKELEQNLLIKILIESYFRIAKSNIGDSVPKSIMRNMVNYSRENLQRILMNRLYGNKEIYDNVLDEEPTSKARRMNLHELRNCLTNALEIVKDVII